ncbi:glycoside hydrolase family 3 protein [Paenibacillus flagellatus]|uniref:glycoside hydrolase family 3 protein n=1 Tax=Paenibacillus flagellatus TaxID=2211139 RepID=UPI00130515F0|nr:glycoside hydrolase family 3 N-terminal domain-containing protein [Paenibacillus flagellatus]
MDSSIEKRMDQLTLEQKIAQMIVVRGHDFAQKAGQMNAEGRIGAVGAVLFTTKGSRQLEDVVSWINEFKSAASAPLLFYLDAKNGIADAFHLGTSFPSLMALGATRSKELAFKMGSCIAKEARALGFGMVSNTVVDVNSNPDNPIINTRAISDRVELIVELAAEIIRGMQEAGVVPTAKHFPGHGDTQVDSHVAMPMVERDKDYLMEVDLKPYRELIPKGLMGIMTAHILYPALLAPDEGKVPATLSRTIMTDLLRDVFGFQGLLISDSLTMRGIKTHYGIERSAVLAVKAGHDLILQDYESDPAITFKALYDAVQAGEIAIGQIESSVRRILQVKHRFNLLHNDPIDWKEAMNIVNCPEHAAIAAEIADKSVTVLENASLPLTNKKTLLIATVGAEEGMEAEDLGYVVKGKSAYLHNRMMKYISELEMIAVKEYPTEEDIAKVRRAMTDNRYDHVIYATFVRVLSYKEGSGTVPQSQLELISFIQDRHADAAMLIFGSPYIMRKMSPYPNCICAYGDCVYSIDAVLKVLYGTIKATGKLPVTVNENYQFGYGLS